MMEANYSKMLPRMLSGEELLKELRNIPEYDTSIRDKGTPERLMKLSDIYRIYLPSAMSVEIYNKLYMATAMSLQKKGTKLAVRQQSSNFKAMQRGGYQGIIGGADSFTIIGTSGIGKSSAIERAIRAISGGGIIETEKPLVKIIPCLVVQCPFDCSSKGMLLEILRMVDAVIGTKYYERSHRPGVTTDILIGTVAQVAINHVGLLVIDEIQNVAGHKNGRTLVGMLTQLINCSGISICMVGTPESVPFFEKAMHLARRSMGLQYAAMPCDDYFREFCTLLYGYQCVKNETEISDAVIEWLYEHSVGVISVVVSLIHDAQEIAIYNGRETLDIQAMNEAYMKRITMLHGFVSVPEKQEKHASPNQIKPILIMANGDKKDSDGYLSIPDMVRKSKDEGRDAIAVLKEHVEITEVAV